MQFVNEEWAKTWQQEYRALREGIAKRGIGSVAVLFCLLLLTLGGVREATLEATRLSDGLVWGNFVIIAVDERNRRPPFSPHFAARLRAVACQALLLVGLGLALQLAFFAVAFSAGAQLTVPLQALINQDPALAWPALESQGARVLTPAALGNALGVVHFTCVGLVFRLVVNHKPKPLWVTVVALTPPIVTLLGFRFVAEATCVATYRSPLTTVAGGLLLIAAFALLTALLGRQWEAPAGAKPAEAEA